MNPVRTIPPRRVISFSLAVAGLILLCTIILPMLARVPEVQRRSEWLDDRGIDPTAMYYTELPAMETILKRQRRIDLMNR